MRKLYYHFTSNKLRDGRPIPPTNKWLVHEGEVIMCTSGLHASEQPYDALQYAPGHILHRVELDDVIDTQDDKVVARRRKIVATIDAAELLHAFARKQALSVIHLWNCPAITKQYLETGDVSMQYTARSAARSAAQNAARSAPGAAWSAADAAWSAAGAAQSAADAAWSAAGAAWSAAQYTAWSAARSAAQYATGAYAAQSARLRARPTRLGAAGEARNAARSAADAADAAWSAIREQFNAVVEEAFIEQEKTR